MKSKEYRRSFLTIAVLAMAFLCPGQAITTKDLQLAGDAQSTELVKNYADTGAVNQPPSSKSLTPDNESPQMAGMTIVWTGTAYDPDGDKMLYQFWLNGPSTGNKWKAMTSWSEKNVWNWTTSYVDSGNNIIDVRVRDAHHSGPWEWDSHISSEFFIDNILGSGGAGKVNLEPSLVRLKSDRVSPQDQGVKVTWTATASDPESDTVLYQYWLKGPSTEEQWVPATIWTTNNAWTWNTAQSKAGIYTIEVRVRDGYHADAESSDDSKRAAYILRQTGIIE
jgi:hypothetical protein